MQTLDKLAMMRMIIQMARMIRMIILNLCEVVAVDFSMQESCLKNTLWDHFQEYQNLKHKNVKS